MEKAGTTKGKDGTTVEKGGMEQKVEKREKKMVDLAHQWEKDRKKEKKVANPLCVHCFSKNLEYHHGSYECPQKNEDNRKMMEKVNAKQEGQGPLAADSGKPSLTETTKTDLCNKTVLTYDGMQHPTTLCKVKALDNEDEEVKV